MSKASYVAITIVIILALGLAYALDRHGDNPRPGAEEYRTFISTRDDYAFSYPEDLILGENAEIITADGTEHGTRLVFPEQYAAGTNLGEASLDTYAYQCQALPEGETVLRNGVSFSKQDSMDAGAGNRYRRTDYTAKDGETCAVLSLFEHSTVRENYPEESRPAEYDRQPLLAALETALSTFRFRP